jgi:hypothetical protein
MNTIIIEPNKHIGILSYPRTGSTILQEFLCYAFNKQNFYEMLNLHNTHIFKLNKNNLEILDIKHNFLDIIRNLNPKIEFNNRIDILNKLALNNIYGVFKVFDIYK